MDELEKRRRELAEPEEQLKRFKVQSPDALNLKQLAELKSTQAFEKQLKSAMNIDVPGDLAEKILFNQRLASRKNRLVGWSLAASFAIVSLLGTFILTHPQPTLSQSAIAHVYREIDMLSSHNNVSLDTVKKELASMNIALPFLPQNITFAYPCGLAGDEAMHLIVQVDGQPVTLLIRRNPIIENANFSDGHFFGQMRNLTDIGIIAIAENSSLLDKLYNQLAGV